MLYWKCENEKCKNFGEEILEINPIFKYTENGPVGLAGEKKDLWSSSI